MHIWIQWGCLIFRKVATLQQQDQLSFQPLQHLLAHSPLGFKSLSFSISKIGFLNCWQKVSAWLIFSNYLHFFIIPLSTNHETVISGRKFSKYVPADDYFRKGLYMFDIGQNDLAGAFYSKTLDQVLASIPTILVEFETGVKVGVVFLILILSALYL